MAERDYNGHLDRQMRALLEPVLPGLVYPNGVPGTNRPQRYSRTFFNTVDHVFRDRLEGRRVSQRLRNYATVDRRRQILQEYLFAQEEVYMQEQERLTDLEIVRNLDRSNRRAARAKRRDEFNSHYEEESKFYHNKSEAAKKIMKSKETRYVSYKSSQCQPRIHINVDTLEDLEKNRHVSFVKTNAPPKDGSRHYPFLHIQMKSHFDYPHFEMSISELPRYYVGVRIYSPHAFNGVVWKGSANSDGQRILEKKYLSAAGRELDDSGRELSDSDPGAGQQPSEDWTPVTDDTEEFKMEKDMARKKLDMQKARDRQKELRDRQLAIKLEAEHDSDSSPATTPARPGRPAPPPGTHPSLGKGKGKKSSRNTTTTAPTTPAPSQHHMPSRPRRRRRSEEERKKIYHMLEQSSGEESDEAE